MPTPAELLAQSLTALRNAKRFSAATQSYRRDNPTEYAKVIAYLDGGARPTGVTTEMGKHALLEEDARRALSVVPPPTSDYIDKISDLGSVFLPQSTPSAQIQQGVTNPPGLGGGIWEISDAAGSGYRFVSTPQMETIWGTTTKVSLAILPIRPGVGQYEEWKFKYRFPIADNPAFPNNFHGGTIFEFGHYASGNSGLYIGLDGRQPFRSTDEGHHLGVPIPPWGTGSFQFYKICNGNELVLGKDYLVETRIRYNPDSTGYVRVKIDGVTLIDENRPMRPNESDIPKCQPGWYSAKGTTKNGVEIRNLEYVYGV